MPHEKRQGTPFPIDDLSHSWFRAAELAIAIGIAYFLAARLGLALRTEGVAVFWPAAGIAVGALITLGRNARLPVSAAVISGTAIANYMIGRNVWLAATFGFVNAGEALLTAWLMGRWFGGAYKLDDVRQVLGFMVASATGCAFAAVGGVATISFVQSTASPLNVWRVWFTACLLGMVTIAPLLIGLGEAMRALPPRRELIEGSIGLVTLSAMSAFLISLSRGPWESALPVALVFPILLWIAVRCRPVFAAAAAFIVALTIIWSTTSNVGHFGDASIPVADRILAAQTHVLGAALLALVLAALFADRRRSEAALRALNAELDHRVKNVLATVNAVVSHTLKASRSMADFATALDGRVQSMARTHDMLSACAWQGVSIPELVRRELAPYATGKNAKINGPEIVMRPEAGQALAMVLHELSTNAAKYGALSTNDGRVAIWWDWRPKGNAPSHLLLEWQEIGGPPVVAVGKRSYGTSTIRDLIPYEFGGTVDLVLAPEGVRCRVKLPADWLGNDRTLTTGAPMMIVPNVAQPKLTTPNSM